MGSAFSTIGLDPIPAASDAVVIPSDFVAFTDSVDHKMMQWVTDQAERDVKFAATVAPVLVGSPTAIWLKISGTGGGSVWKTIWADSGAITSGFTNGTDFIVTGGYVRKVMNSFVKLVVLTQRKNSALVALSSGNITGDPVMFTLPTSYWPSITTPGIYRANTGSGRVEVDTAGAVRILDSLPSYTISIDETVVVEASFFTP